MWHMLRRMTLGEATTAGVLLAVILLGVLLSSLTGCAVRYDKGHGVYGAVACVNVTGPGFSWLCPDKLQVPAIPEAPQPSLPK